MLRSELSSSYLPPAESILLSSIQRAKERIFNKSINSNNSSMNNSKNYHNNAKRDNNIEGATISSKQLSKNNNNNNENNSLVSNSTILPTSFSSQLENRIEEKGKIFDEPLIESTKIKREREITKIKTNNQLQQQTSTNINTNANTQNHNIPNINNSLVAVNAIKLLQEKIQELENKNKHLESILSSKHNEYTEQKLYQNNIKTSEKDVTLVTIEKYSQHQQEEEEESDLKSYLVLKQECESLQKENASLYEELSKQKDPQYLPLKKEPNGRKLNFHHEISQNVSHVFVEEEKIPLKQLSLEENLLQKTINELQEKLNIKEKENEQYKSQFENEKKRNFTILKLHQEEIIKNEELQLEMKSIKEKLKESQEKENQKRSNNNHKVTERRSSYTEKNMLSETNKESLMMKQKHQELEKIIMTLREELEQENITNEQLKKENTEVYQKYLEVKETFIELYKDLLKYHPEVVNANIKFLYERIRKGEDLMLRSRSIISGYSRRMNNRMSQTKNGYQIYNPANRLSEFRSKSGKKGLKMEDLNSSKRSLSRDRTNSKNSNRSISKSKSKSGYRSPYAQENLVKRNTSKSVLSPSTKPLRNRSTTITNQQANKNKLSEIQKIIKEIKEVSRDIKAIKSEHRNLSVKINTTQNISADNSDSESIKNQERMNELIEEYNEKNAKLQELKMEKDRLALETVPDILL